MTFQLRYSAGSHVGMVRKGNEDSGYASSHLLVIADGMGGHAAGEVASATALHAVLELFPGGAPEGTTDGGAPGELLRAAVARAGERLREMIVGKPELEGMGTTLTALLQLGDRVAIAQVGDSRGYLLRNGVLEQVTHDQTFVQSLVDQGRISHDDARIHPQRSLLLQALDGRVEVEPVIALRSPQVGDRYLLCSDGLSGVLSEATMRELLMVGTPDDAVEQLIALALRGGAPDNVTCVVADVVDSADPVVGDGGDEAAGAGTDVQPATPTLVGAAADDLAAAAQAGVSAADPGDSDGKHVDGSDTGGNDGSGDPGDDDEGDDDGPRRLRGARLLVPIVLLLVIAAVAGFFGYRWTQSQYYVGTDSGQVVIYRGVPQHLVGHSLSKVVESSDMQVASLPTFLRDEVDATISASSLSDARKILANLRAQAAICEQTPTALSCPGSADGTSPSPFASQTSTGSPTTTATASPSVSTP